MSTVLCTFPGRAGDLLWALPTIRALSRRLGTPVDLLICGEFAGMIPLLLQQSYLDHVWALDSWGMGDGWQPPTERPEDASAFIRAQFSSIGGPYKPVFHLGYRRWPAMGLPFETLQTLNAQIGDNAAWNRVPFSPEELDLATPWITVPDPKPATPFLVGFSECHFELKFGVFELLTEYQLLPRYSWHRAPLGHGPLSICVGGRWKQEAGHFGADWLEGAQWMHSTRAFLGCNSGWHVLAVAMGKPVVMLEPMEARWNHIFFPLGHTGPQVTLVTGNDGLPTVDARHVGETLERILRDAQ